MQVTVCQIDGVKFDIHAPGLAAFVSGSRTRRTRVNFKLSVLLYATRISLASRDAENAILVASGTAAGCTNHCRRQEGRPPDPAGTLATRRP